MMGMSRWGVKKNAVDKITFPVSWQLAERYGATFAAEPERIFRVQFSAVT